MHVRKKVRRSLDTNHKVPNGGWVFHIGKITLMADNRSQLIENLRQYREANKIALGNLANDIDAQIKQNEPTYQIPTFKMIVRK